MDERHLDTKKNRKQWSSETAFVFSMAAAAIGLGNLWRFPYMAGENGGAAFIVAYLLALVVVAMPIMMLEVAAGRCGSCVSCLATGIRDRENRG
jgi:NSS family neurotransmitter:Na+ symporter